MSDETPASPGHLRDGDGPTFQEPWQAHAFAMTLALHERGLFSWSEWSQALATQIAASQADAGTADDYYRHWLAALEKLAAAQGVCSTEELLRYRRAWEHVAERTQHGQPLELQPGDLGS